MSGTTQKTFRIGLIGSSVWSFIVLGWRLLGEAQTAQGLYEDRNAILALLMSSWFGPAVTVVCLAAYLYVSRQEKRANAAAPFFPSEPELPKGDPFQVRVFPGNKAVLSIRMNYKAMSSSSGLRCLQ